MNLCSYVFNSRFITYIFLPACKLCQTVPQGVCHVHKQPAQPLTSGGLSYAVKSLPSECKLGVSNSVGDGYGVYTNQPIPTGTWIGPFEGTRIRPCDVTQHMDTSHMWEVSKSLETLCNTSGYSLLWLFYFLQSKR